MDVPLRHSRPETARRTLLLFDGDCGLCTYLARKADQVDGGRRFEIRPYQAFSGERLRAFGLDPVECARRVYAVECPEVADHAPERLPRKHGGAFAVNLFLRKQRGWSFLVAALYMVPVLLLFEILFYKLVSDHRHRISSWLRLTACAPRK